MCFAFQVFICFYASFFDTLVSYIVFSLIVLGILCFGLGFLPICCKEFYFESP